MESPQIRILLIDDDEEDYIVTRTLLSQIDESRFVLEWAATAEAGLEKIARNQHDVYLLDYQLGECTGLEVLRAALARGCTAPIIMLTGTGDREVDVAAMRIGAADYIDKGDMHAAILERMLRYALERHRLQVELRDLTLTDHLTGLYNRRGFLCLAQQQLKALGRSKKGLAVLFADLDGLKQINDAFGHEEGDAALVQAATLLKQTFRDSDIVARLGGDEFVVLTPEVGQEDVDGMTARLQRYCDEYNAQRVHPYQISLSLGVAIAQPWHSTSLEDLLNTADQRLYEQKRWRKRQPR
jgi:diguanylate cyclase (GGDEF)-like protein